MKVQGQALWEIDDLTAGSLNANSQIKDTLLLLFSSSRLNFKCSGNEIRLFCSWYKSGKGFRL